MDFVIRDNYITFWALFIYSFPLNLDWVKKGIYSELIIILYNGWLRCFSWLWEGKGYVVHSCTVFAWFFRDSPITSTPVYEQQVGAEINTESQPSSAMNHSVSSPVEPNVSINFLTDIVKQIGNSIGENIVTCLESRALGGSNQNDQRDNVGNANGSLDLSRVNLIVKSDIHEPPFL